MSIPLKGRCSCHKPRMPGEQVGEYDSCALESLKRKCEEYHTLSGAAKPKPCMEMLHFRRSLLCPRRPHLRALALKSVHCSSPPKSGKPLVGYRWAPHYEDLIFFCKERKRTFVTATSCWRLPTFHFWLCASFFSLNNALAFSDLGVCVELDFESHLTHPPFQSKNSLSIS